MTIDYNITILNQFNKIELIKVETPSAGTKYRLMGLAADIAELTQMLQQDILCRVCHEAPLDVDVEMDYTEMSERVLAQEFQAEPGDSDVIREHINLVNDALGELSNVLAQIAEQLERHHKDDEYVRLYEAENRRYMASGTAHRERQAYEEWKEINNNADLTLDDVCDYRMEKVLNMFEKGVFNVRVEQIRRVKRYPGELDFDHIDEDRKITKTAEYHYMVLRKIVDFADGMLVVNPARVGQHFFMSRKEPNAKQNRTNFLKYMHKISLAQEEYRRLLTADQEEESAYLPDVLATGVAMKYWKRLQIAGFVDERFQLMPDTTRKQAMYIADVFSDKLQMRSKWKPFQELWHINNLAQEKWEMQETGKTPTRSEDIDAVFSD